MSQEIKIMTPVGEVSIPYSEDAIMVLAKKLVKVSGGEPNLLEEAVVEFIGIDDYESCDSDWLFWEDTHVSI